MTLLTARQAAAALGVHHYTITRWHRRDGLPIAGYERGRRGRPPMRFWTDDLRRHATVMGIRDAGNLLHSHK
jgi:hypothetical protein